MQGMRSWLALGSCLFVLLSGCSVSSGHKPPTLIETQRIVLPAALSETSGLYCQGSSLLTINDSGNSPLRYTISTQGDIENIKRVKSDNHDWEAVTVIDETVFIADIGNNKGRRTDLSLIELSESGEELQHSLGYSANQPSANTPYAHDYDAEALTARGEDLILFSKSWESTIANVYVFRPTQDLTALTPDFKVPGLPGVITGADWDETRNEFVIVGYRSDPFGNFDTFIAQLSDNFEVGTIWPLPSFKQAEGICVSPSGSYWMSQEASDTEPALLVEFTRQ